MIADRRPISTSIGTLPSGLALFTPAEVFYGRVEAVAALRQAALDDAYGAHPDRFPNGPPVVRRPPTSVAINPLPIDDTGTKAAAISPAVAPEVAVPTAMAQPPRPRPSKSQRRNVPIPPIPS